MTKKTIARKIVAKKSVVKKSASIRKMPKRGAPATPEQMASSSVRHSSISGSVSVGDELYHFLFDASPDAIVIYDRNGNLLLANSAFEQTFGWTLNELVGRRLDFVPAESCVETKELIERMYRDGKVVAADTKRLDERWTHARCAN